MLSNNIKKENKLMKKLSKILGVFLLALVIVACSGGDAKSITPAQANEKIEAKNSFMLIVESSACSACIAFKPTVEQFEKDNPDFEIYTMTIDKLDDAQAKTDFLHKYSITATPTSLFFKNGELKTVIEGVIDEAKLTDTYNKNVK